MARRSSIKRLPPDVKTAIDAAIREDRCSLDEILASIREAFGDEAAPSRSALHRYRTSVEEQMQAVRESREIADVWAKNLGEAPDSDIGKVVLELLRTMAYRTGSDMIATGQGVEPKVLSQLARAMQQIEDAGRLSLAREQAVRDATIEEAAESAETAARSAGMSAAGAAELRRKILMGSDA